METSPIFLKWRALAFGCISFLSLLWIILLCIIAYGRWDISDRPEKAFIAVLLLTNTINMLMLPILIIREFRPWLDGARLLFLLSTNIGVAAYFTYWYPLLQCSEQTPDDEVVCKMINFYILLANWVNPVLLIAYSCCLGFLVWSRSRLQNLSVVTPQTNSYDEESSIGRFSMAPVAFPEMGQRKPLSITIPKSPGNMPPRTISRDWYSWEQEIYLSGGRKESPGGDSAISRPSTAARLSKQQRTPLY